MLHIHRCSKQDGRPPRLFFCWGFFWKQWPQVVTTQCLCCTISGRARFISSTLWAMVIVIETSTNLVGINLNQFYSLISGTNYKLQVGSRNTSYCKVWHCQYAYTTLCPTPLPLLSMHIIPTPTWHEDVPPSNSMKVWGVPTPTMFWRNQPNESKIIQIDFYQYPNHI